MLGAVLRHGAGIEERPVAFLRRADGLGRAVIGRDRLIVIVLIAIGIAQGDPVLAAVGISLRQRFEIGNRRSLVVEAGFIHRRLGRGHGEIGGGFVVGGA